MAVGISQFEPLADIFQPHARRRAAVFERRDRVVAGERQPSVRKRDRSMDKAMRMGADAVLESVFDEGHEGQRHNRAVAEVAVEQEFQFKLLRRSEALQMEILFEHLHLLCQRDAAVAALGGNETQEVGQRQDGFGRLVVFAQRQIIDAVEAVEQKMRVDLRFEERQLRLHHRIFQLLQTTLLGIPLRNDLQPRADDENDQKLARTGVKSEAGD